VFPHSMKIDGYVKWMRYLQFNDTKGRLEPLLHLLLSCAN
jgi:hypothetical protein